MKKFIPLFLFVFLLAFVVGGFAIAPAPVATAQAGNLVKAFFQTTWTYDSPDDTFTNGQVTGWKRWKASAVNPSDETGAPVTALALSLESGLAFDDIVEENLVTPGPPNYEWSFGDVPEGSGAGVWVDSLRKPHPFPVTFSPGFDASRSVDKIKFSGPAVQTLTITLTPREVTEGFDIAIQAPESPGANPVITSPTGGDGIQLSPDGHSLHISPMGLELNTTWSTTVTIRVVPKLPEIQYMPDVLIEYLEPVTSRTTSGSFVTQPLGDPADGEGTWIWSAEGNYEWTCQEALSKCVNWSVHPRGTEEGSGETVEDSGITVPPDGNLVKVHFPAAFSYAAPGDSFTNGEVAGQVSWRAMVENTDDLTGAPVNGLVVTLDSDLAFDSVYEEYLTAMGPPTYEWSFGELVEESKRKGWPFDAIVGFTRQSQFKFTPGVDASRSFDKTVFTAPDIQTVTITVTPREEWVKKINIYVHTYHGNDLAHPVVISYSSTAGGDVAIAEDGQHSGIHDIPVELNTPVTVIATIQVTPKVPWVEYKPNVGIHPQQPSEAPSGGTISGSSFSYTNEAGTWTISGEGDYVWMWIAPGSPSNDGVGFFPKASQTPNIPPVLTSGGISPASGATTEPFAFEVTYKDADRNAPSFVRVYVDGSAKDMDFWSGLYIDGALFRYATTLSAGQHTYYFEASDGSMTTRFPEDGTLSFEVPGEGQALTPAPTPTPTPAQTLAPSPINWLLIGVVVAGFVLIVIIVWQVVIRQRRAR